MRFTMIKAVANFFAAVIGIFIILAVGTIASGIYIALGANTDQQALSIGIALAVSGVVILFSLGMACVLLDIMFNVRKISEDGSSEPHMDRRIVPRTEPEL
jgi:hypothetical protein